MDKMNEEFDMKSMHAYMVQQLGSFGYVFPQCF